MAALLDPARLPHDHAQHFAEQPVKITREGILQNILIGVLAALVLENHPGRVHRLPVHLQVNLIHTTQRQAAVVVDFQVDTVTNLFPVFPGAAAPDIGQNMDFIHARNPF